jgi:hypothetical protein
MIIYMNLTNVREKKNEVEGEFSEKKGQEGLSRLKTDKVALARQKTS